MLDLGPFRISNVTISVSTTLYGSDTVAANDRLLEVKLKPYVNVCVCVLTTKKTVKNNNNIRI